MNPDKPYLSPYLRAAERHGAKFESLLWASPQTQLTRFDALARLCDFHGRNVLDAGCGRADFLDYLLSKSIFPAHYVGIEAVDEMLDAARGKNLPRSLIIKADFVRDPARLLVGADIVVFCGSLNTLGETDFYSTLRSAFAATTQTLIFNFLCSSRLAGADWLSWHSIEDVTAFAQGLKAKVQTLSDYMEGDCTMAMRK